MNNTHIGISFCIPVYNAEKYLEICIDSILNQDFDDYEIICVDDCSSDSSAQILTRLAQAHSNVTVLKNETNQGVSSSRNRAIRAAGGDYLWFVDADDILAPDTAALYLRTARANDADAVFGNCCWFLDDDVPKLTEFGSDEVTQADFTRPGCYYPKDQNGKMTYGLWSSIFRRSCLLENHLFFREDFGLLEDVLFYFEFGMKADKVTLIDHIGYYYRVNSSSTSHYDGVERNRRYFEANKRCLSVFRDYLQNCEEKYHDIVNAHLTERKECAAVYLFRVPDRQYVRSGLQWLKSNGYYPYRHDDRTELYRREDRKKRLMVHVLLPNELMFWLMYYYRMFRSRIRR